MNGDLKLYYGGTKPRWLLLIQGALIAVALVWFAMTILFWSMGGTFSCDPPRPCHNENTTLVRILVDQYYWLKDLVHRIW